MGVVRKGCGGAGIKAELKCKGSESWAPVTFQSCEGDERILSSLLCLLCRHLPRLSSALAVYHTVIEAALLNTECADKQQFAVLIGATLTPVTT